ncbi:MAG: triose-phosphate isomerase [Gammaproteobacteria bacterium]|nr:triose-phosphate isomerase [Gammaproteobacteria bacterium]
MRQTLVAGNWKMNGTLESVHALVGGIKSGLDTVTDTEVVVCPPFVYLETVSRLISGTSVVLGAQNVAKEDPGAFTGEIAAPMLRDFGCQYVIVGHSERRNLYGETDSLVADKFARALQEGLKPILCVGELLEEREAGKEREVVARQVNAVIEKVGIAGVGKGVIAYEPVWAIGTGKTASPEQAQEAHAFIREQMASHDGTVAESTRILYGGSVNAGNIDGLVAAPDIDGGLIGGASLKPQDFLAICRA